MYVVTIGAGAALLATTIVTFQMDEKKFRSLIQENLSGFHVGTNLLNKFTTFGSKTLNIFRVCNQNGLNTSNIRCQVGYFKSFKEKALKHSEHGTVGLFAGFKTNNTGRRLYDYG